MMDFDDYVVETEACGKRRTKYRCHCRDCEADIGYKRKKTYERSGLCRRCSQRRAKDISESNKKLYTNVDFSDWKEVPYNKNKSKGNGYKKHYRVKCKFCGYDKGYVRRSLYNTRCRKCVMTEERRAEVSASLQRVDIREWSGYISPENTRLRMSREGREWRNSVFNKFNYTCDITGKRGGSLHAHHLESFSTNEELRFDVDNGVCISEDMHKEFHRIYGKRNNTRGQYEEFKKAKRVELGLDVEDF